MATSQRRQLKAGSRTIAVSNLEKVLYPANKFTKGGVLHYYARVAPFLLPHFRDRPVTLVRYPDGVRGESFYEKNAPGFTPSWIKTYAVPRTEHAGEINYILINDAPTLIWVANLAALELHPFLHRVPDIDQPTHVVFDLDPGEGADILACAEVAFLLRDVLAHLNLECFAKVSGSKGIQIYVPLNRPVTYRATSAFAHAIAELLTRQHPDLVLAKMAKILRQKKVFIDWSQNDQKKTTIGVYSLRAKRDEPFISMPIAWDELRAAWRREDGKRLYFEPEAALARLQKVGDLFAPVLTLKQKLPPEFAAFTGSRRTSAAKYPASRHLEEYAAKRDFSRTAEPAPALPRRSEQGSRRRFVIQKHAARQLHYDFRLEMHDVLKSWAVPKGMPLAKGEKRGGFHTEDHPIEYLDFEGVIPQGQYGGGTVMVWDIGTYELMEGNYHKGELKIFLTGQKLKGEWYLKRLNADHERGKNAWLFIKTDKDAPRISARQTNLSSLTGRTMEQIADEKTKVWQSNRGNGEAKAIASARRRPSSSKTPAGPAPEFIPPMRATLVDELPEGPNWIYEIKWDGYRGLAVKHGDHVRILSLKNKNLATDFPAVVRAIEGLPVQTAVLDGEVVAVNARGQPSFQVLQNRSSLGRNWHIVYYAFDLLNLEGEDLRQQPLEVRKEKLRSLVEGSEVRFSASLPGSPQQILQTIKAAGLEGLVAKRKDSVYVAKTRSMDWQKFKASPVQEFVIGGYNPDGETFSSLLLGYYEGAQLMFAGKVRQGFNPRLRAHLMGVLKPLRVSTCPFVNLPSSKTGHFGEGITAEDMTKLKWARPRLVAQVSFTEWTNYGLLRHANFLGLREDKEAKEVVRET